MRSLRLGTAVAVVGLIAACSSSIGGQAALPAQTGTVSRPTTPFQTSTAPPGTSQSGPTQSGLPQSGTAPSLGTPSGTMQPGTAGSVPTSVPDGAVGSTGIGDPYYPTSGNGGYQVDSYDVALSYDPADNQLAAVTTVTGTVTQGSKLGRFNLDLQPTMTVSAVSVNGIPAAFEHRAAELIVTPATGLPPKSDLTVEVTYAGRPASIPGGTAGLGNGGWYRTRSGGAIAIGEPFSASAWYPVNEHPSDTASIQVTATVPKKWSVISNGVPITVRLPASPAGSKVFRWNQKQPITSYESTIYIDTFATVRDITGDGKPIISAFSPSPDIAKYRKLASDTKRIVQVLSNHFGDYPFDSAGGIYTGETLSFALETATRPVYADWVDTDTIVHELTHQWFGDDVVIRTWADICLNECFASYGPWLWHQDVDHADLDALWVSSMAKAVPDPTFWSSPLVDMGPGEEFTSVYSRGPLAVHALRKEMGEKPFAALLKGWPAEFGGGRAASWAHFVTYVNTRAKKDITPFLDAWFKGTTVPAEKYLHPGGLGG